MFLVCFRDAGVFLELYRDVQMVESLMGPETCIEVAKNKEKKVEVRQKSGGCQRATVRRCLCWPRALFFRSVLLVVGELNLLKSFPPRCSAKC